MRSPVPAVALLAIALSACTAERAPSVEEGAAPADAPDAMANDPAAPPPMEQDVAAPPPDAPAPGSDAAPGADAASLARFDGYGDLRFGMSAQEATQAWGGELKGVPEGATLEAGACHYLTPKWVKVPSDFAFMIEGDRFVRYDVGTGRETAPGGGKVGMDAGQIHELYAGRVEESPHKYVEGGKYLKVSDAAGGDGKLVFVTDADGKVTAWRAGVPPQVDYVEGCS